MTAPAANGTKYPQPVDELLPAAREIAKELGEVPARNELMRRFRIGAPKAGELRDLLIAERAREIMARDTTTYNLVRGGTGGASDADLVAAARRIEVDPTAPDYHRELARELLQRHGAPAVDPWDYAEPIGPDPLPPMCIGSTNGCTHCVPESVPVVEPVPTPVVTPVVAEPIEQVAPVSHPGTEGEPKKDKPLAVWPVWLLMLPAFVAVWAGWVELGKLTGFGPVDLLPGFTRDGGPLVTIDTAITLPIGMETYAAYALYVWLSGRTSGKTRKFAMTSALIALSLGAGAQITYHLIATPTTGAPWQITTVVACLPVVVLGIGAALGHLVREDAKR
ncbi:ABC transporter permease [Micromonospora sp. NPDC049175]|uniref:ABC transporter permease n=1 Tax=Micromonospora sp. NPDC049175 TaxID=3364266 RepID=UPI0037118609